MSRYHLFYILKTSTAIIITLFSQGDTSNGNFYFIIY